MAEVKEVHHTHDQPVKVLLQRTGSGYHWEVHCTGRTVAEILPVIREADKKLRLEYGGKE